MTELLFSFRGKVHHMVLNAALLSELWSKIEALFLVGARTEWVLFPSNCH